MGFWRFLGNILPQNVDNTTEKIADITNPISGYTLTEHLRNVQIASWEFIPSEIKPGNKVVLIQEPTNEADDKAVLLMFVPQRKKFGYLYRGEIQDKANNCINQNGKIVARLSYLSFKPHKVVKIDMAFFKKNQ
jgi:hypothetical protein